MNASSPVPKLNTQVFISYAHEDTLIAAALEKAFYALRDDDNPNLTIVRDVHTFKQGGSLTGQIHDQLQESDVLFVIYTERLKNSYSFTGFEIGAFANLIDRELKECQHTDKRTVSLYFEEPPGPLQGLIGIKLDVSALDEKNKSAEIDPENALEKFFHELSDLIVRRKFIALFKDKLKEADLVNAQEGGRAEISVKIVPQLKLDLREALSSVVARHNIEQHFIHFEWDKTCPVPAQEVCDETKLTSGNTKVYEIFGVLPFGKKASWKTFKDELCRKHPKNAPFVTEAIESAIKSAFDEGPVDNDQIFLSAKRQMYRVIVTRYFEYYDGTRSMHVYFIPFLSNPLQFDVDHALILLRLSAHLRSKFLLPGSSFHPERFDLYSKDFEAFTKQLSIATSTLQIIAATSHNAGLDEERNFEQFFGKSPQMSNAEIANLYAQWKAERDVLLDCAAAARNRSDDASVIDAWKAALQRFVKFADPINKQMGERALKRLQNWYSTGQLD
ncbi:hypothetical protein [Bradyrhizobium sp.]|uniref:hypothetical protein n=1 Tax=Bradyrhizobium sp. TaxID=376 RepID=UPI002CD7CE46|nr:hypothetical protein [Bradyrhizobium sp.]HMM91134.1 TIR domain-containing protein [Bradyrhizobium sp.]